VNIKSVAYVGIGAADPGAWLRFGTEVLGMMPARANPGEGWGMPGAPRARHAGAAADGSVYLKMDERQWRIAVHPDSVDGGLLYLGLQLDSALDLEKAVSELRAQRVAVRTGSDDEAYARAVSGIAFLRDPAGNALELFYGPTADYSFASPCQGQQFVAGHLGVGHFNLFVKEQAACFDFYTRLLGFRLSDYIRFGRDTRLQFLRCNARHHSIAMVDMGGFTGLQHMLVELRSIDDVGRVLDRALRAGVEISSSLGRHRNDGMLSFYMRSPGGFDIEVGCDGLLLDDTWTANEFCEGDVWGHAGLVEAVQRASVELRERADVRGAHS
jgi:3,4-dihydroxy-9,10-secoandrosta-1,3,5(10)-triene-9,17-dione 4,5-dioxygenase